MPLLNSSNRVIPRWRRKNNRDLCWRHRHTSFILNLFSPERERGRRMAWLFMPILRSGLRTFNESAEEREEIEELPYRCMRGKDEVRQTDIDWTFFHRPVTLRDRTERGKRVGKGDEEQVSETTSGEANFSSRFSRIILGKKGLSIEKFLDGWCAYFVALHVKRLWKGRRSPFRAPASKGIWILAVSSNLYVPRWNVPCVLLRTEHKAHRGTR